MYSTEEKVFMVRLYYSRAPLDDCQRVFVEKYGGSTPSKSYIYRLITKFEATGSVANLHGGGRKMPQETVDMVQEVLSQTPTISLRKLAKKLNLPYSTCQRAAKRKKVYKKRTSSVQKTQTKDNVANQNDDDPKISQKTRKTVAEERLQAPTTSPPKPPQQDAAPCSTNKRAGKKRQLQTNQIPAENKSPTLKNPAKHPHYTQMTNFTNDAWFHLSQHYNSQIPQIWAAQNPYAMIQAPLYAQQMDMPCAIPLVVEKNTAPSDIETVNKVAEEPAIGKQEPITVKEDPVIVTEERIIVKGEPVIAKEEPVEDAEDPFADTEDKKPLLPILGNASTNA